MRCPYLLLPALLAVAVLPISRANAQPIPPGDVHQHVGIATGQTTGTFRFNDNVPVQNADVCVSSVNHLGLAPNENDGGTLKLDGSPALGDNSFTIEFWNARAHQGRTNLYRQGNRTGEHLKILHISWYHEDHHDTQRLRIGFGNQHLEVTRPFSETKNWHHYAFVYDKDARTMRMYMDGVEIANASNFEPLDASVSDQPAYLANRYWNKDNYIQATWLDELRIAPGVVRTAEQIAARKDIRDYEDPHYWPFEPTGDDQDWKANRGTDLSVGNIVFQSNNLRLFKPKFGTNDFGLFSLTECRPSWRTDALGNYEIDNQVTYTGVADQYREYTVRPADYDPTPAEYTYVAGSNDNPGLDFTASVASGITLTNASTEHIYRLQAHPTVSVDAFMNGLDGSLGELYVDWGPQGGDFIYQEHITSDLDDTFTTSADLADYDFGETYTFRFRLVYPGKTFLTSEGTFYVAANPAPTFVNATVEQTDRVKLSWGHDAVPIASSGYDVFRDGVLIRTESAGVTGYDDFEAVPGVVHTYCVQTREHDVPDETPRVCAPGRKASEAVLTGRVVSEGTGVAVEGADVYLTFDHNRSLNFDGVDDYAEVGRTTAELGLTESSFTVELWVNPQEHGGTFNGHRTLLGASGGPPNAAVDRHERLVLTLSHGKPYMGFFQNDLSSDKEVALDQWTHLAFVYQHLGGENGIQRIYVNGVLDAERTGAPPLKGNRALQLGTWTNNTSFDGAMDEVRIWNHARTEADLLAFMDRPLTGLEGGLSTYLPMDPVDGQDQALRDRSGHGPTMGGNLIALHGAALTGPYQDTPLAYHLQTDAQGQYRFEGFPHAGDAAEAFTVRVDLPGYEVQPTSRTGLVLATSNPDVPTLLEPFSVQGLPAPLTFTPDADNPLVAYRYSGEGSASAALAALLRFVTEAPALGTPEDVDRLYIEYGVGDAFDRTALITTPAADGALLTATLTGMATGKVFKYRFAADYRGGTIRSDAFTLHTSQNPPPQNVAATTDQPGGVTLTWDDRATAETGFDVYRDGVKLTTTPLAPDAEAYVDATALRGEPHRYCVRTLRDENLPDTGEGCTVGLRTSDGLIAGRVTDAGGSLGLDGVEVRATSEHSRALLFDGVDDYAVFARTTRDLGLTEASFTAEVWVRPTEFGGTLHGRRVLLGVSPEPPHDDANQRLQLALRFGRPLMSFFDDDLNSDTRLTLNEWTHLAFVYDYDAALGTGTQRIYINGVQDIERAGVPPLEGNRTLHLGTWTQGVAARSEFAGTMDEVRLWTVARTPAEIQAAMHAPLSGGEPGLMAYLPFDDLRNGPLADRSARGAGLTDHGVVLDEDHAPVYYSHTSTGDGGFAFAALPYGDGTTFTVVPSGAASDGTPFTITPPSADVALTSASPVRDDLRFVVEDVVLPTLTFTNAEDNTRQIFYPDARATLRGTLELANVDVADVSGLRLEYGIEDAFDLTASVAVDGDLAPSQSFGLESLVEHLVAGNRYRYRFAADYRGVTLTSDAEVIDVFVAALTASYQTYEDRVVLQWNAYRGDRRQLRVERQGDNEDTPTLLTYLSGAQTTYADRTGVPNKQYTYCIRPNLMGGAADQAICDVGRSWLREPGNVTASDSLYTDRVRLTWRDDSDVETHYFLVRDGTWLTSVPAGSTHYDDFTAVLGERHTYCVRTQVDLGNNIRIRSNMVCDDGSVGAIVPPTQVAATDGVFPDRVEITWSDPIPQDDADNEEAFQIWRAAIADAADAAAVEVAFRAAYEARLETLAAGPSPADSVAAPLIVDEFTLQKIAEEPADATRYEDGDVSVGQRYLYCVAAARGAGTESLLVCNEGRAGALTPPAALAASTTREDRVSLEWVYEDAVADSFDVYRAGTPVAALGRVLRYDDLAAVPGDTTEYCIRARTRQGSESTPVCTDGLRVHALPIADLKTSTDVHEDRIVLSWTNPSTQATLVHVLRDGEPLWALPPTQTTLTDREATPGVDHVYAFINLVASGATSDTTTIAARRVLAAPTGLSASFNNRTANNEEVPERALLVTWTDNSAAENGYRLWRVPAEDDLTPCPADLDWGNPLAELPRSAVRYEDATAASGVRYCYRVATFDALGESEGKVDLGRRVLHMPDLVTATDGRYEDRVVLTWTDKSRAEDGYRVWRQLADRPETLVLVAEGAEDGLGRSATRFTDPLKAFSQNGRPFALRTDGTGYAEVAGAALPTGTAPRTLEAWVRTDRSYDAALGSIAEYGADAQGQRFALMIDGEHFFFGGHTMDVETEHVVADGQWHHVAVVFDGSNIQLYVDGHGAGRTAQALDTGAGPFRVGHSALGDESFNGDVDEVRLWSRVRTQAEIRADMDRRLTGAEDGLVLYLPFDDGSGATAANPADADAPAALTAGAVFTAEVVPTLAAPAPLPGAAFDYFVAAYDASGTSDLAVATGATHLTGPTSLRASDQYEDRVTLTWVDESDRALGYRLTRDGAVLATLGPDATTYVDAQPPSHLAEYCVQAVAGAGRSEAACTTGASYAPPSPFSPVVAVAPRTPEGDFASRDGGRFGWSTALFEQDVLLAGEPVSGGTGRAHFFAVENGDWTVQRIVESPNPVNADLFGFSVDVYDRLAVVGAPGVNKAYVYRRSEGLQDWALFGTLEAPGNTAYKVFGEKVAVTRESGQYYVAVTYAQPGLRQYGAFVYWVAPPDLAFKQVRHGLVSSLPIPADQTFDATVDIHGHTSIALDGKHLVFGATLGDPDALYDGEGGRVWFYRRLDDSCTDAGCSAAPPSGLYDDGWGSSAGPKTAVSTARLDDFDLDGELFGATVHVDGNLAIATAPHNAPEKPAHALIFRRDAGTGAWSREATLTLPSGPIPGDQILGASVYDGAAHGNPGSDRAAFGAYKHDYDGVTESGAAFVFENTGGAWTRVQTVTGVRSGATQPSPKSELGFSVALYDAVVVAGAPLDDAETGDGGALYITAADVRLVKKPKNVKATDGEFDTRVQLTWERETTDEDGFRVFRDGLLIAELPAGETDYADVEAVPGALYEYCVAAFAEGAPVQERTCDRGWRKTNGAVAGRVSGQSGGSVSDVSVCLVPSPNRAAQFDGEGAYLQTEQSLDITGSFTVELWARRAAADRHDPFVTQKEGLFVGFSNDNTFRFGFSDANVLATSAAYRDARWHHWAAVYDATTGTRTLYRDGTVVATGTAPAAYSGKSVLRLGRTSAGADRYAAGFVDDVRIWRVALDAASIAARRMEPLSPTQRASADLLAYYSLNQVGSLSADNKRGSNNHLRGFGGLHTSDQGPTPTCAVTGSDGGYSFTSIPYGSETTFRVVPSDSTRSFTPEARPVTLSMTAPVQNEIEFSDVSSYAVEGLVQYAGTYENIATRPFSVVVPGKTGPYVCAVPDAQLMAKGAGAATSEDDGSYSLALPRSSEPYTIIPSKGAQESGGPHIFQPSSRSLTLLRDEYEVHFTDETTTSLVAYVGAGGQNCPTPMGKVTLKITTPDGCFEHLVTIDTDVRRMLDGDPNYNLRIQLPPQRYWVSFERVEGLPAGFDPVDVKTYFENLGPQEIDLTNGPNSLRFAYRAPLSVNVDWKFSDNNTALSCTDAFGGAAMLTQGNTYNVGISVFEDYGNAGQCPLGKGEGTINIIDNIADSTSVLPTGASGDTTYTFQAGFPDFTQGREEDGIARDYQQDISFIVDVPGRPPSVHKLWAIVAGRRTRPGTFVTGMTEPIDLLVLRDPPGSNSFAYLQEGRQSCYKIERLATQAGSAGAKVTVHAGTAVNAGASGIGFHISFTNGTAARIAASVNAGRINTSLNEDDAFGANPHDGGSFEICASTTERWETSGDAEWTGEDLYIGAGLNLIFALDDLLEVDVASCTVDRGEGVAIDLNRNKPFHTDFVYGKSHIESTLVPSLETLKSALVNDGKSTTLSFEQLVDGKKRSTAIPVDSLIADWRRMIADDADHVANLMKGNYEKTNRSFSAGNAYSYESGSDSLAWKQKDATEIYVEEGIEVGIVTVINNFSNEPLTFVGSYSNRWSIAEEKWDEYGAAAGYTLSDGDPGDYFSIDIVPDPKYGTFAFKTVSGRSSNPYEANTQPRDSVNVIVSCGQDCEAVSGPPTIWVDDPNGEAVFQVSLQNLSPSGEQRDVAIALIPNSNPGGARIEAGGGRLGSLDFVLDPYETQDLEISVKRGPRRYVYDSLAVLVYPPGEYEILADRLPLSWTRLDTAYFSVRFMAPCTDIELAPPDEPSLVRNHQYVYNGAFYSVPDRDVLLTARGYEVSALFGETLQSAGFEYRRQGTFQWFRPDALTRHVDKTQFAGLTPGADADSLDVDLTGFQLPFDLSQLGLNEGAYEVRAFSACAEGEGYSQPTKLLIDKTPPRFFDTPSPSDQVLHMGDDISFTMDEEISCQSLVWTGNAGINTTLAYADGEEEAIPIDVVCDGRKVILKPREALTEGRLIEATVLGGSTALSDPVGNRLARLSGNQDHRWQFTVNRSGYAFSPVNVELKVTRGTSATVATALVNGRARQISYTLPETLELALESEEGTTTVALASSRTAGSIVPGGRQALSFTLPNTLDFGTWTGSLRAAASENGASIGEVPFFVTAHVVCEPPPDWAVNPAAFQYGMSVTAQLFVEGAASIDAGDVVAAYVDGELRGLAGVVPNNDASGNRVHLMVYANQARGEVVTFQVWDDDACRLHDTTGRSLLFDATAYYGTPGQPISLQAPPASDPQALTLNTGWTWFSVNKQKDAQTFFTLAEAFSRNMLELTPEDVVKSQTHFAQYDAALDWIGSLSELDPRQAYLVRMHQAQQFALEGQPVSLSSTPIEVHRGWNWVGYLPQASLPVDEALRSLTDGEIAQDNDLIKSQAAFAQYYDGQWVGSLEEMRPGQGYLLHLANVIDSDDAVNPDRLVYPEPLEGALAPSARITDGGSVLEATATGPNAPDPVPGRITEGIDAPAQPAAATGAPDWQVAPSDYQFSLTLTGALMRDGEALGHEATRLAAFVELPDGTEELRGVARLQHVAGLDAHRAFLVVYANEAAGEVVYFKVYDGQTDRVFEAAQTLTFAADAVVGTVAEPEVLTPASATATDDLLGIPAVFSLAQNYPNPFNPETTIRYGLPQVSEVRLAVYDVLGRHVRTLVQSEQAAGYHEVTFDARDLASGVYFYRLEAGDFEEVHRMVLVK